MSLDCFPQDAEAVRELVREILSIFTEYFKVQPAHVIFRGVYKWYMVEFNANHIGAKYLEPCFALLICHKLYCFFFLI